METNEAPEKIYVHEASVPELTEKLPYHIEYTRTDAFIEKVVNYLNNNLDDVVKIRVPGTIIPHRVHKMDFIDEFAKNMKG